MKKKIAKFFIIIGIIAGAWGLFMLAEYAITYKERYSDISQSEEDKKAALTRAEKAVYAAAEEILTAPENNGEDRNDRYAQFGELTFVDGIYEQWIFKGEPENEALLHMHFKKQDGSDLYMAVKHYPMEGNKWVEEMYGKDHYDIISGSVSDSQPDETAYEVIAGKRSDDFEEFSDGAFLSDCRRQYGQATWGYYYILVKAKGSEA